MGLSQESLALKSKTGVRSIVAWEQGKNLPNGINLNQLADALGVQAAWLLGNDAEDSSTILHDETPPFPGMPTKQDCVDHVVQFLESCENDPAKIAWTKVELQERFPLTKWKTGGSKTQY